MTGTQRTAIASPAEGLMVYQTNAPIGLWMFINGAWVRLTSTNDIVSGQTAFAANTAGAVIVVALGGTNIPLPSSQSLGIGSGITINGANDAITVANAGRYRIAFAVNTTASVGAGARVLINGTPSVPLTITPVLATGHISGEAVVTLTAGSVLNLQLFGIIAVATLLNNNQGAALTIQRID